MSVSASVRQQLAALDLVRTIFKAMREGHADLGGIPDDVRLALADVGRTRRAVKRVLVPGRRAVFGPGQYGDYMERLGKLRDEIDAWFDQEQAKDARAYVYALLALAARQRGLIRPGNRGHAEWGELEAALAWLAATLDPDLEARESMDLGGKLGDKWREAIGGVR
ncbi:hypothetical protein [Desulfocurvibacter africanus]|uniref:hypothetical protein n=1 Tax=Desulfocurvibacter africanus TaxID=873 RepID=UPI0004088535|nr:hypothetical protein [Desulfocurvibacter africanus]